MKILFRFLWLFIIMINFGAALLSQTLTLRSHVAIPGTFGTDVWGYVDPVTGKEYAIAGDQSASAGITIVDVSNPDNAVIVATENSVPGFDVKVWNNYVYTVTGGGGQGGIVDISDPLNPVVVGNFPSSHNIFASRNGFLIDDRLNIYDLNATPAAPDLLLSSGTSFGHDVAVIDNRLYDFHGTLGTRIYDFSDPANPQQIGIITDPSINYHHSGWVTADHNYLFICDELATHPTADITAWDISDLGNPQRIDQIADSRATVHNLQIVGNYAFVSYYTAGLRVYDISDPANMSLADEYDTSQLTDEGFGGAFGVYAFLPSGLILVNDWQEGVFVFSFDGITGTKPADPLPAGFELAQNYPNPFNPVTTISFKMPVSGTAKLNVYNVMGQKIRTLLNGVYSPGAHSFEWDGRDDTGNPVASGIYLYRLQTEGFSETKQMILLR